MEALLNKEFFQWPELVDCGGLENQVLQKDNWQFLILSLRQQIIIP